MIAFDTQFFFTVTKKERLHILHYLPRSTPAKKTDGATYNMYLYWSDCSTNVARERAPCTSMYVCVRTSCCCPITHTYPAWEEEPLTRSRCQSSGHSAAASRATTHPRHEERVAALAAMPATTTGVGSATVIRLATGALNLCADHDGSPISVQQ